MKAEITNSSNLLAGSKPLILAGPCSAETEEQLLQTAHALSSRTATTILRAGIWKPRTNPGGFEGIGLIGLSWLLRAKKETGLKTAIEVATAEHAQNALQFETDVLWLGARTTVNPFSVQEIADSLRGTKATVLVKNPVNPDVKLWSGAIERLLQTGITNIGLIHRGFNTLTPGNYRNAPMWQLAIEMRRRFPELPMIIDPSHICGKRDNLLEVTQKGLDLGYNGVMIESHINPDNAWTDQAQQITPAALSELLDRLIWRKPESEIPHLVQIDGLREQINLLDEELVQLLQQRLETAQKIGYIKQQNNVAILQTNRWNDLLVQILEKGNKAGLNDSFLRSVMETIHLESIRLQKALTHDDN